MHPYFKLKGIVPGIIHHPRYGDLDFRGDIPFETLKKLYETGFIYIGLTAEGKSFFHPVADKAAAAETKSIAKAKKHPTRERKN